MKEQGMPLIILILILAVPVVELSVLIDVGGDIGAINTVLLCFLTAAIGLWLVRLQGMKVILEMQRAASRGEPVGKALVHGFFLMVAGVFLLIPGFITDALGALLLIPPFRLLLARLGFAHFMVRRGRTGGENQTTIIIEGDYVRTSNHEAEPGDQYHPPLGHKDREN